MSLVVLSGPVNGRLRRFTDNSKRPLEHLLNAFVGSLLLTAQDIKDERVKEEQRQRDSEEAERRAEEFRKERAAKLQEIREEEKLVAELKANAAAWESSQSLRRYIEAARAMVVARDGEIASGGPVDNYLSWATRQADRLDPLVKSPPSILDEKAKWERLSY